MTRRKKDIELRESLIYQLEHPEDFFHSRQLFLRAWFLGVGVRRTTSFWTFEEHENVHNSVATSQGSVEILLDNVLRPSISTAGVGRGGGSLDTFLASKFFLPNAFKPAALPELII